MSADLHYGKYPLIPYAGIGSRETPKDVREKMELLAMDLAENGFLLRSGGAPGADMAFEFGVDKSECPYRKEIFLPWQSFNELQRSALRAKDNDSECVWKGVTKHARELALEVRPGLKYRKYSTRTLMARNCFQVLGWKLKVPVRFIICWTPNGEKVGGTAFALELNERLMEFAGVAPVRVFNLALETVSILEVLDWCRAQGWWNRI